MQDIDIEPIDIDILTDKDGAYEINRLLKEYESFPVKFSISDLFQSHFGVFTINGIKVEVMGELKEKIRDEWRDLSMRLSSHNIVKMGNMIFPVTTLKEHLKSYEFIGREKDIIKIQKIREFLKLLDKNNNQ